MKVTDLASGIDSPIASVVVDNPAAPYALLVARFTCPCGARVRREHAPTVAEIDLRCDACIAANRRALARRGE